ncbi:hypothetical protein DITRI_Ditri14bG0100300 [Diplodiscus trichospermus]
MRLQMGEVVFSGVKRDSISAFFSCFSSQEACLVIDKQICGFQPVFFPHLVVWMSSNSSLFCLFFVFG